MYGLLSEVRSGRSATLVLLGEAGMGKTALMDDAIASAPDLQVARAVGVESEMELAFAGLHQLCGPMLDRLDRLPGPQRDALGTTFGLQAGQAPDRLLVGLAVLSLLSEVARERPLVCVVDDAQWLDRASAQALTFVARRLLAESVLMLFAAREATKDLSGLPELPLRGLQDPAARELLASVVRWPLDERVRERIVAETRGNPLALLELPRGLSPAQLARGFGLADAPPLSGRIEESFRRRFKGLPDGTRLLLVVLAADPVGESWRVWRAAEALGVPAEAATPAAEAGLLDLDGRVVFRHPLMRSAVYRAALRGERQKAHAALAEATDPEVDPDRRAWHRAQAAVGPDEEVAAELDRSADRARRRGGLAAAAAFLERAVILTLDPARRAKRALIAAQAKHLAGATVASLALLAAAEAGPLDERERVRADLLRAQIAYTQNRGGEAAALLLGAAKRLEPLDVGLARETLLDALWSARFASRLAPGAVRGVAQVALAAPPVPTPRAADLLLDGSARALIEGYAAGVATLKQAVSAFRSTDISHEEEIHWLWPAAVAALDLWDDDSFAVLAARHVQLGRETGALTGLPIAFSSCVLANVFAGELLAAEQLIQEMRTVTEAMDSRLPPYGPLMVAAWRGREAEASALIDAAHREVASRGEGAGIAFAYYARAVLYNGRGRYQDALAAATASDSPEGESLTVSRMGLVELIEAAARTGAPERASEALERLSQMARASGTDWALGIEARSRALLSAGDVADRLYGEAVERLGRTRIRGELARAHLLYGEWLRRQNRRTEARTQLRVAHQMLTTMGIESFAERARHELLATGETVRKRSVETLTDLTEQEAQIARLAADGCTNPEIGAQLFISSRTVEWHLRKVFTKLGVGSRRELRRALPGVALRT